MRRADFHYKLPTELIAQEPLRARSSSRLLALDGVTGATRDLNILDLPQLIEPGDLLVFNDTRVIPARLTGSKPTGGQVELLLERPLDGRRALLHARASKAVRPGLRIETPGGAVEMIRREGDLWIAELPATAFEFFESHGQIPLPPYIAREPDAIDRDRYQSRFARHRGGRRCTRLRSHSATPCCPCALRTPASPHGIRAQGLPRRRPPCEGYAPEAVCA